MHGKEKSPAELEYLDEKHRKNKKSYFEKLMKKLGEGRGKKGKIREAKKEGK